MKSGGRGKGKKGSGKPKKSGKKSDGKPPKIGRGRKHHTSVKHQTAKKDASGGGNENPEEVGRGISA